MIILLVVVILAATGSCNCGTPPPTTTVPPPTPCTTVLSCVSSCGGTATAACAPCPAGTFDQSLCAADAGPGDASSCDETPCFRPYVCATSCEVEPFYEGCCTCPLGSIDQFTECDGDAGTPDASVDGGGPDGGVTDGGVTDGGPGGLLPVGEPCFDDRQCLSGLCFGEADASGAFRPPVCQAMCLPADDRGHWCRNDRHCCEGTCCTGCGELEGLCRTEPGG